MKLFVLVFAAVLAVVSASTFELRNVEVQPRDLFVPVLDAPEPEGRITNGKTASSGQFPHQVGLSLTVSGGTAWCGGSLIAANRVLTAAHCVDGVSQVQVYLGSTVRTSPQVTRSANKGDIIIHSGWNSKTLKNDIAMIRIASVSMTSTIKLVALPPNASSNYAGSQATVSGWGRTSDSSNAVANNLQYATMTVITNAVCANTYGSTITATNICVSTTGGVSTCNGDSGGPLISGTNGPLIGIVSFGSSLGCAKGYPAAFTRVTEFLSWINLYIKN